MKRIILSMAAACVMLLASCSQYKYETVAGDPLGTKIYTLDNGLRVYMSVNKETPRIQTYIAVKVGGKFVAMKSKDVSRETSGIERVSKLLSISSPKFNYSEIHHEDESFERCIVEVVKNAPTPPKYPRAYAQIKKKPIF